MTLRVRGRVILASASPRRAALLRTLGLTVETIPSGADETPSPGESPREHVRRLAEAKARGVAERHPEAWVLGADTVVVADGLILGKPASPAEARAMLERLSGAPHEVLTGFALCRRATATAFGDVVATTVLFRPLSAAEIAWYADLPEPYDKAGAYAAQGVAACFIREIRGSYTNVVGLPLCEVAEALLRFGVVGFEEGTHDGGR